MCFLTSDTILQKLVVVEFKAMWCGPCKIIAPAFEKMQEEFPSVVFTKVDVDTNEETQAECNVQHLPTFQFYKGGQKVGEVSGVDEPKIRVRSVPPYNVHGYIRCLFLIALQAMIADNSK